MTRKFLGTGIDGGAQRGQNFADPSSATDLATKQYVDNAGAAMSLKNPVRVASTANITVASALINAATIDGIAVATGDRVLLKAQTAAAENGIYVVVASGAASRATDTNSAAKLQGALVTVNEGTVNADTMWYQSGEIVTLGTTAVAWAKFAPGTTNTAGNGISISSGVVTAVGTTGISVTGPGIGIDTAVVVRKYASNVGDGSATAITRTHGLGTLDTMVQLVEVATGATVECDVTRPNTNDVTLTFAVAPAASAYRVVVQG